MPTKLSNYLRLRYYQYEVTFGLYVMTPGEKAVLNSIILGIMAALLYALFWGFEPFVVRTVCRMVYYITGSLTSVGELCTR